jgi:hypothetical protein
VRSAILSGRPHPFLPVTCLSPPGMAGPKANQPSASLQTAGFHFVGVTGFEPVTPCSQIKIKYLKDNLLCLKNIFLQVFRKSKQQSPIVGLHFVVVFDDE